VSPNAKAAVDKRRDGIEDDGESHTAYEREAGHQQGRPFTLVESEIADC
jgi:hypothetical protein